MTNGGGSGRVGCPSSSSSCCIHKVWIEIISLLSATRRTHHQQQTAALHTLLMQHNQQMHVCSLPNCLPVPQSAHTHASSFYYGRRYCTAFPRRFLSRHQWSVHPTIHLSIHPPSQLASQLLWPVVTRRAVAAACNWINVRDNEQHAAICTYTAKMLCLGLYDRGKGLRNGTI